MWFWAGLFALVLGALIVTPFFQKPADAVSYGMTAVAALLAMRDPLLNQAQPWLEVLWVGGVGYVLFVLTLALAAMLTGRTSSPVAAAVGARVFQATNDLSNPRAIFALVFLLALIAFHRDDRSEFTLLFIVGGVIVLRPLELLWVTFIEVAAGDYPLAVADLFARQEPGILVARQRVGVTVSRGEIVAVRVSRADVAVGVVLDRQSLAGEDWLRIARITTPDLTSLQLASLLPEGSDDGAVHRLPAPQLEVVRADRSGQHLLSDSSNLVGIVAEGSDLSSAAFDVTSPGLPLSEGRLVRTRIAGRDTLFQVIAGVSSEEVLSAQNRHGFARARARKIGTWDAAAARFHRADWLPSMNEPVFLLDLEDVPLDDGAIGRLPGSPFGIRMNIDSLVTHNCAILGILGVGKTTMAFELIERTIQSDVKVVVLDLTDEYAIELGGAIVPPDHELVMKEWGKTEWRPNQEEGGGVEAFRELLRQFLAEFLASGDRLLVVNPADFNVWKQTGYYQQRAPSTTQMASLSPVEITRLVSEELLAYCQAAGKSQTARVQLVLEEAHSLTPEWNSTADDGDRTAVNGTSRALIQGRKYGLGYLLVTQRTANVTKTLLNQCNTIVAFRTFDATGLEFLKNYIGNDYTGLLSTLQERHAVVFGKACSSDDPLVIRVRERDPARAAAHQPQVVVG